MGVSVCLCDLVCSWVHQQLLLQENGVFQCRICFLPIKQALISVVMTELRGFRGSRYLSLLCAEQTRLLCLHKKLIAAHQSFSNPNAPVAVVGAQQM